MNRELLRASRVEVQVDWIAGDAPLRSSLDALAAWLSHETGLPPAAVDVHEGAEIPRPVASDRGFAQAAVDHASPPEGSAFVYVLFADRFDRYRGITWTAGELDGRLRFPVVVMLVGAIKHDSWFPLSRRKIEPAVLVHEFGHVAGLVTGGRRVHDGHCPDPKCRMYHGPDWRAIRANAFPVLCLWNLPLEFCDQCEADLASARN